MSVRSLLAPRITAAIRTAMAWALMGVAGMPCAQAAVAPYVKARLVQVDVYDRVDGSALTVYSNGGRNYIVGTPGHEYAVRIRNCTGARLLVVTSVDGVNVISGDTAAASQSGYVLDAWGSVEIAGWRKSLERTAAFYFTDLGDSYAARTGRPQNVGVVGVAVFQEKLPAYAWQADDGRVAQATAEALARRRDSAADAPYVAPLEPAPALSQPAPAPGARAGVAANAAPKDYSSEPERKALGKLGTGHGRSEDSHVAFVAFERSTQSPVETVAIQYDRRENLIAMNVLPRPYYAQAPQPDPFPASMRFAPDPAN